MHIVAVDDRRHPAYIRALGHHVAIILIGQVILLHAGKAAIEHGRAAPEDEHHVLTQRGQLLLVAAAKAFSHPNQEQQRPDAPRNAEHGEERTQLMRPQGAHGLPEDVEN